MAEQWIFAEAGSTVYAVLHGDLHVRGGHPVYRFEPFPLEPWPLDEVRARQQPSRLLGAESRIVRFTGRRDELDRLAAWRDDPAPGVSTMLVHGPGGQGKSRLAAQFAVESAGSGWNTWAAHHVSDPTAALVVAPGDTGPALVVVVEYAERWPADDLQLLLQNPLLRRPERARVLLVSRPVGGWWPALRHWIGKADIAVGGTINLQPLAGTEVLRREVFADARDRFASVFGVTASTITTPAHLHGPGYELVLTLHMAALVTVDAHARGGGTPLMDPIGLSAYLLDREHDHWQTRYDHDQAISTSPRAMARTVFTATLVRPQQRNDAVSILWQAGIAAGPAALAILDDHANCYPPNDPALVLEPLYPDRLGEDFVALQTPGHQVADYLPDAWAATAPARLVAEVNSVEPGRDQNLGPSAWTRPALTVLIETALRWPHVAERQLVPLLQLNPRLALDAGGAALARLTEIPGLGLLLLGTIEPLLPQGRHVDLHIGAAALAERLTASRLTVTTDDAARAALHLGLGSRQANAGRHQQALASCEQAVDGYRRLVQTDPDTYLVPLSNALTRVGIALSDLGRHDEAVVCAEECVGN